jgi:hypothetical protein
MISSRRTFWACVALLIVSAALNFPAPTPRVAAQAGGANPIDQAIVDAFRWRSIGPDRGGRSIRRVRRRKAGRASVLRRRRRRPVEDDRRRRRPGRRSPTVSSRAPRSAPSLSPTRIPTSVYIGMGESCIAATSCLATASTNRPTPAKPGRTVGFANSDAISKIRIHPTNPDIVFVAGLRQVRHGPSDERGVYKSTDGGKTWKKVLGATTRPARSTSESIARIRT